MGASSQSTGYDRRPGPRGVVLGLSLLGLAIFAWLPDSYFRMVSWPWILVWQAAFWGIMASCWGQLRRFNQPFYGLGFGLDWLVMALVMCLIISTVSASFPRLALQNGLLVGGYIILLYGLRNSGLSPLQLCRGLGWVGAIAAIISLALWRPTPDMWLSDNFYDAIRNRFPLGHHNFTGGYFALVWPLTVGLAWLHKGWQRWGYAGLSLLTATALYASGSRGAWLGGVTFVMLAIAYSLVRSRGKTRLVALILSIIVFGLVILLLASNPRIRTVIPQITNTNGLTKIEDGPTLDRFFMVQAAGNILRHRPLTGLGPGNLGRVYERYRPITAGTGLSQVQQLHNTPLQMAVELGMGGLFIYLGVLSGLVGLAWQLQQRLPSVEEKCLVLTLGASYLSYGVSSLSDYQLENIPIATTLTVIVASLTKLVDDLPPSGLIPSGLTPSGLTGLSRRWLSVCLLGAIALTLQFWLRTGLALFFTHQGIEAIEQGRLTAADSKFYRAAQLTPWDPTPRALAAQQLSELARTATVESQTVLQQEARSLYQQSLTIAPNDIWFNQNLAVLAWQTEDIATAQAAIRNVVQLSPRSPNYSYYLLGLIDQALGKTQSAIEAFALECLINPQTIMLASWQQQLAPIKHAVFERVLAHYQTILTDIGPEHPLTQPLQNQIATVRWWSNLEPTPQIDQVDRHLLKAILVLDDAPKEAIRLLDQCLEDVTSDEEVQRCALLKAWLQPDDDLSNYLPRDELQALNPLEKEALRLPATTQLTFKTWLLSTTTPVQDNQRVALSLLYRSYYASRISSILVPEDLRLFSLPVSLALCSLTWPREFLPLDTLVETLRTTYLGLPHPTYHQLID